MEQRITPDNLVQKVLDFAEKWNKYGELNIFEFENGNVVAGIQIGNPNSNLYELIINIDVEEDRVSGYVMAEDEHILSTELIIEAKRLSEEILNALKISVTFGG